MKLIDVFDDAKCVHIIQELCEGGELFYQIQKQAHFSERDAAAIVKQVASALFHLHAADIVHRDVKPENLLYSNTGANALLKISDFGLSHITGQKDPMVGLFGTMDYIAPEVLRERRFVKGRPEDTAFRRVERCEGSPLCRRQLRGDNALLLGAPPFAHDHRYSLLAKQ